jgi:hypothetical protein
LNTGPSPQTKDQAEPSHSISMHLVALPSSKLKPLRTARRNPHLRSVWEIKSGGHDADDHVVLAGQENWLSHHSWVRTKGSPPHRSRNDGYSGCRCPFIVRYEQAPQLGIHA